MFCAFGVAHCDGGDEEGVGVGVCDAAEDVADAKVEEGGGEGRGREGGGFGGFGFLFFFGSGGGF